MKLDKSEVVFHPLSGIDWRGRLFWWKGGLYRAIHRDHVSFYEYLLSAGIVRNLVRRKLLIDTEATDLQLDGYGLVLEHHTVPFVSYCYEWCGEMLKAAALSVLELEKELLHYGLALVDPQPQNVLFLGTTPVWIDLGSLIPASQIVTRNWNPYEEFSAHFTRPLQIMAAGHSRVARCLLRDGYPGVQEREVQAIADTASAEMIRNAKATAKAFARKVIPSPLRPFVRRTVHELAHPASLEAAWEPISSVRRAVKDIEKIRLIQPSTESSNDYGDAGFPDFRSTTDWTPKQHSILRVLSAKKPDSVLDTSSSRGWYSQLAAHNGAQVVSVDFDEAAVVRLFFDAVAAELPILPLMLDFGKMGLPMAMTNVPGLAPAERLRCDMVLALAPIHHLALTASHFNMIVTHLSAFARKWLVIECVGGDDIEFVGRVKEWYTLNDLLGALNKEFGKIERFPSDKEPRTILLCER
jgi:hypothetical protein